MRKPLVAGNWKMNGSSESIKKLLSALIKGAKSVKNAEIAVCPPYIYIPGTAGMLSGTNIVWGSQNVATEESGAYTGEIAVSMLKDFKCTYAIVGHSERRTLYGDTDLVVADRFARALAGGVTPMLCVGETLAERESGSTEAVVERQLKAVIDKNGIQSIAKCVIAYEPVWAIGTGKTASPEQAQDVHAFIRNYLAGQDMQVANGVRILYGGSVNAGNAKELFAKADIDGGLIGGASLKADDFLTICNSF